VELYLCSPRTYWHVPLPGLSADGLPHSSHCIMHGHMADAPTKLRRLYPVGCYYELKRFDHLDFRGARVGFVPCHWPRHFCV